MTVLSPHGIPDLVSLESPAQPLETPFNEVPSTTCPRIPLSAAEILDLYLLAIGAYSPLEGFMKQADYRSVCQSMQLQDGTLWPIPITCSVSDETATSLKLGQEAVLVDEHQTPVGIIQVQDIYKADKPLETQSVYKTSDEKHPGVLRVLKQHNTYIGGTIRAFSENIHFQCQAHHLPPAQMRQEIARRGWKTVVAFQTRNPIHRAHEYLQKCALEMTDGLLVHPLVGETKPDDIPADVRMDCYQALLSKYYNPDRTLLSVYPAPMRYAGPREALLHAIARQNYGCTHIIIGRDHAGVGNYYGTYEAQQIFTQIPQGALAIQPIFFDNAFYCKICQQTASLKTCPHPPEHHVMLSGTKVRQMLLDQESIPPEFSRAEVAAVLEKYYFSQKP